MESIPFPVHIRVTSDGSVIASVDVTGAEALRKGVFVECERGKQLDASALCGWPGDTAWNRGGAIVIPEGEMCPRAWGAFLEMPVPSVKEEGSPTTMGLSPLFSEIIFHPEDDGTPVTYTVTCPVNGYSFPELEAVEGVFRHAVSLSGPHPATVRIPKLETGDRFCIEKEKAGRKKVFDCSVESAGFFPFHFCGSI